MFREREGDELLGGLEGEIEEVEKAIREVQGDTYRLRGDYRKVGEYLESEVTKAIYQTFNDVKTE